MCGGCCVVIVVGGDVQTKRPTFKNSEAHENVLAVAFRPQKKQLIRLCVCFMDDVNPCVEVAVLLLLLSMVCVWPLFVDESTAKYSSSNDATTTATSQPQYFSQLL